MIRESHELMQWMLNLRTYELKIYYNITIKNHIDRIENQILYKQMQFNMSNFRNTIHDLMKRTQNLLFQRIELKLKKVSLSRIS